MAKDVGPERSSDMSRRKPCRLSRNNKSCHAEGAADGKEQKVQGKLAPEIEGDRTRGKDGCGFFDYSTKTNYESRRATNNITEPEKDIASTEGLAPDGEQPALIPGLNAGWTCDADGCGFGNAASTTRCLQCGSTSSAQYSSSSVHDTNSDHPSTTAFPSSHTKEERSSPRDPLPGPSGLGRSATYIDDADAASRLFNRDAILVCFDYGHNQPYENYTLGISTLDTREIKSQKPGYQGSNWLQFVRSRYIEIPDSDDKSNERGKYLNERFYFGMIERMSLEQGISELWAAFHPKPPHALPTDAIEDLTSRPGRDIVLVGWSLHEDLRFLSRLPVDTLKEAQIVQLLDAQTLVRDNYKWTLGAALDSQNLAYRDLHNSGNDARYTLHYLIARMLRDEGHLTFLSAASAAKLIIPSEQTMLTSTTQLRHVVENLAPTVIERLKNSAGMQLSSAGFTADTVFGSIMSFLEGIDSDKKQTILTMRYAMHLEQAFLQMLPISEVEALLRRVWDAAQLLRILPSSTAQTQSKSLDLWNVLCERQLEKLKPFWRRPRLLTHDHHLKALTDIVAGSSKSTAVPTETVYKPDDGRANNSDLFVGLQIGQLPRKTHIVLQQMLGDVCMEVEKSPAGLSNAAMQLWYHKYLRRLLPDVISRQLRKNLAKANSKPRDSSPSLRIWLLDREVRRLHPSYTEPLVFSEVANDSSRAWRHLQPNGVSPVSSEPGNTSDMDGSAIRSVGLPDEIVPTKARGPLSRMLERVNLSSRRKTTQRALIEYYLGFLRRLIQAVLPAHGEIRSPGSSVMGRLPRGTPVQNDIEDSIATLLLRVHLMEIYLGSTFSCFSVPEACLGISEKAKEAWRTAYGERPPLSLVPLESRNGPASTEGLEPSIPAAPPDRLELPSLGLPIELIPEESRASLRAILSAFENKRVSKSSFDRYLFYLRSLETAVVPRTTQMARLRANTLLMREAVEGVTELDSLAPLRIALAESILSHRFP